MDKNTESTIIIIAGPTGVGKTALAIELAKHFNTEIISADSRQCYREMKIGVARPTEKELSEVKHHFIASHSVAENVNAGDFEKYALAAAAKIFKKNKIAIMVGGTGLYIKAFCEGIDPIPIVPEEVRQKVMEGQARPQHFAGKIKQFLSLCDHRIGQTHLEWLKKLKRLAIKFADLSFRVFLSSTHGIAITIFRTQQKPRQESSRFQTK